MQSTKKVWRMMGLCLNTGERKYHTINVPCTLAHYIRAIGRINQDANIYGVVYLPDAEDEDYKEFIK